MTDAPRPVHALPVRFAVVGGVTNACSVGGLALTAAGHGVAAWALMTAGILALLAVTLSWRTRVDGPPLGTSLGALGGVGALLALVIGGGLLARATVGTPWLAALVALAVGAATAALLRGLQLRAALSPA